MAHSLKGQLVHDSAKAWQPERDTAGHIASTDGKQRKMNSGTRVGFFRQSGTPGIQWCYLHVR